MLYVASENMLPILVALLIGFVTGLWIWKFARKVVVRSDPPPTQNAPLRRPYVENRPVSPKHEPEPFAAPRPEPEVLARRKIAPAAAMAAPGAAVRDVAEPPGEEAADDLQVMKGVGPKLASLLRAEGYTRYAQIAGLGGEELARLDAQLGAFRGRLVRDRIVEQAAFLAAGDRAGYERAFGKL